MKFKTKYFGELDIDDLVEIFNTDKFGELDIKQAVSIQTKFYG